MLTTPPPHFHITDSLHRQRKLQLALVEDSAYSEEGQRNMKVLQISTPKQQTHSECKSRVRTQHRLFPQPHANKHPLTAKANTNVSPAKEAGLAFERAAAIQTKNLSEPDDAANTLVEAFKVYRKTDPEDAARVIDVAINHYTGKGNFRRAATHKQNQAEVYEEMGDQKRAMEAYELAASWFESDNAES